MRYPRLIHPIAVQIRKSDHAFTAIMDHNLREPVGPVRRPQKPINLVAQISRKDSQSAMATQGAVEERTDGYLLFLYRDLVAKNITIDRGDQIIKIGDGKSAQDVDLYVVKTREIGHYQHYGGPTMVKAYFRDRQPAQQR